MTLAHENLKLLTKAGFSFEEFGDMTIKLTSVPGITEDLNTKQLFTQILDSSETVAITDRRAKEERFLSLIAENIADKILEKTSEDEIRELLDKLLSIENPFNYVQGKTIAIKMSRNDLERKFSRR
jgi:DNA mismatch repair protein MutL